MSLVLMATAFSAGLIGSTHCLFMCGSLAAVAAGGVGAGRGPASSARHGWFTARLGRALRFQLGRGSAYLVLGSLAGAVGSAVDVAGSAVGVSRIAMLLAGGMMIAQGVHLLWARAGFDRRSAASPPRPSAGAAGARGRNVMTRRIAALLRFLPPSSRAVLLGATTGLLPCGFLWSFVAVAAGTGSTLGGAAIMAAFALGTGPATLGAATMFTEVLSRMGRHATVALALAMLITGGWSVWQRGQSLLSTSAPSSTPTAGSGAAAAVERDAATAHPSPSVVAPAEMSCCHAEGTP